MHASDVFRKKFSKDATRGFGGQTALSELGLFLGGVLLAKMGDDGLRLDGEEEQILTLLSIALGRAASPLALGHLRRNTGKAATNALPRSTSRKAAWASSTRKPPIACRSRPS